MSTANKCFALGAALVFAAAGTVAATTPAQAETASVLVPTAGIDLASPAGLAIIRGRINRAANQVCGPYTRRDLAAATIFRGCYSAAVTGANDQLVRVTLVASAQPITVAAALR